MDFSMEVDLKISDKVFKGNVRDVVKINEGNLIDEFSKQPSIYAWFATLAEMAIAQVERLRFDLSITRAKLDSVKRAELMSGDSKKITESMVEAALVTDARIMALTEELMIASKQVGILKAIVRSLEQRCSMLVQLGATKRQEMLVDGVNIGRIRENNN